MANVLTVTQLAAELTRNVADYQKIFGLKMLNGFGAKADFTVLPVLDRVALVRDTVGEVVQPGKTGTENFTDNVIGLNNRWGETKPFKADIRISELELDSWSKLWLAKKNPNDPNDIYSFAAQEYYMSRIMASIGRSLMKTIYKGVYNPAGGVGGVHIADGLKLLFAQGIATTGPGWVGDIPAAQVATAATTINASNVVAELQKLVDIIIANETLFQYTEESADFFIDPVLWSALVNAYNAAPLTFGSQVVSKGEGNNFNFNLLPGTTLKPRMWLYGEQKMVWTPTGNLFWLTQDGASGDIPSIVIEARGRNLYIYIDGKVGFNYADGRVLVMNNK